MEAIANISTNKQEALLEKQLVKSTNIGIPIIFSWTSTIEDRIKSLDVIPFNDAAYNPYIAPPPANSSSTLSTPERIMEGSSICLSTRGLPEPNELLYSQVPEGRDDELGPEVNELYVQSRVWSSHSDQLVNCSSTGRTERENKNVSSGYLSLPKGPNAFIYPFEKGMQWLCCLALDPGLLTSDVDGQSGEGGAEEEGASQKPQALNRASTALPLINLSSRPMSESQSLPNALRSTQKPHPSTG
ncbi:hypothetical protein BOTNAR_0371g00010 [Botryotinia narcissicola]|uniref:Uncharacterized protein n=1 Tax=Botryotinia narcissicola TaxID=278944 RepID=A0A4Z1HQC5_9HELO|nr:hypothetical protein BOTNAR_0371g00010 [Botryotinia narcissicola]